MKKVGSILKNGSFLYVTEKHDHPFDLKTQYVDVTHKEDDIDFELIAFKNSIGDIEATIDYLKQLKTLVVKSVKVSGVVLAHDLRDGLCKAVSKTYLKIENGYLRLIPFNTEHESSPVEDNIGNINCEYGSIDVEGVDASFDFRYWNITPEKKQNVIIQALEKWGNDVVNDLI